MDPDAGEHDHLAPLGPRRLTVLFDVTNKCNLRCRFCYFSYDSVFHRPALHMDPALFERVAAELLPLAHTAYLSAGSESLAHPRFLEILEIAGRYAVPTTKLLTNALLLTPRLIDGLIEHGLSELHVSADGATASTYEHLRRGGRFDRLLEALRTLAARKRALRSTWPRLQFNVALMRSNLDELELFVELAQELGVERIACRLLMAYEGLDMEGELTSHEPARANERFLGLLERATRAGIAVTSFPDFYPVAGRAWEPPLGAPPRGAAPPIGSVDVPASAQPMARDCLLVSGWALAEAGIDRVEVRRTNGKGGPRAGELIGLARRHNATRPDVALIHRRLPEAWRAGWTFELLERDLLPAARAECVLDVVAVDRQGAATRLGTRRVSFTGGAPEVPHLYCTKPFDNVYVDSAGKLYPYPDCQTVDPFGDLASAGRFRSAWYGEAFRDLRRRVVERDPPAMCRTCPDFINRNVADQAFFRAREVESALRRPLGFLDAPGPRCECADAQVRLEGWALGFSPVVRIDILRDRLASDPQEGQRADGNVLIGSARPNTQERSDVARAYPGLPNRERAGWHFHLLREHLPAGRATRVRAVAVNADGRDHVLGETLIRFAGSAP